MSEKNTSSMNADRADEDILLELNFVPQWAKKAPGENHYQAAMERSERSDFRGVPRSDRRDGPPRSDRRPPRRDDARPASRDAARPPRRDDVRPASRDAARPASREDNRPPRRDDVRPVNREEERSRPVIVNLPVTVRFLPEQKRLASLVRQIHHSNRAYPLMDLAHIFLSDPRGHMVKIEVEPGAGNFKLYQGKQSKMVATDRDVLLQQLLEDHMADFFTQEVLDVEPPSGNFPMIAKVDDLLIAPPNHHSYTEQLAAIHRAHYSGMPFDRFKQRVQTVRDEELVAKWKVEVSKKTVYRLKEGGKEFSLIQAEEYLREHISASEIEEVKRAVLPSTLARKIKDYNLIRTVRESWQKESVFPIGLAFSLRAAFRHLHLYTFKAGKNINFVTAVQPVPIDPEAAVENIRTVLEFLADHPGSTRQNLVDGLRPGAEKDSPQVHEILNPIRWLVEKGHIVEFFNGTLSVPANRSRKDNGPAQPRNVK